MFSKLIFAIPVTVILIGLVGSGILMPEAFAEIVNLKRVDIPETGQYYEMLDKYMDYVIPQFSDRIVTTDDKIIVSAGKLDLIYVYDENGNYLKTITDPTDVYPFSFGDYIFAGHSKFATTTDSHIFVYDAKDTSLLYKIPIWRAAVFHWLGFAGDYVVVGDDDYKAPDSTYYDAKGAFHVYDTNGELFYTVESPYLDNLSSFGVRSVSDKYIVASGGSSSHTDRIFYKTIYVYDVTNGKEVFSVTKSTVKGYDGDEFDVQKSVTSFGTTLSIVGDKLYIYTSSLMQFEIYDIPSGSLSSVITLDIPETETSSYFKDVSVPHIESYYDDIPGITEDYVIVIADFPKSDDRFVYLFDIHDGKLVTTLTNPNPGVGYFANVVSTFNDKILVGDYRATVDGLENAGAFYIYGDENISLETLPSTIFEEKTTPDLEGSDSDETLEDSSTVKDDNLVDIPDWLKNNVGWWADGQIDDSSFVLGIQYMIENNIIKIGEIPKQTESSTEIPDWVRINAKWWMDGLMGDSEFLNTIQFLVSNGIIAINNDADKVEKIDTSLIDNNKSVDSKQEYTVDFTSIILISSDYELNEYLWTLFPDTKTEYLFSTTYDDRYGYDGIMKDPLYDIILLDGSLSSNEVYNAIPELEKKGLLNKHNIIVITSSSLPEDYLEIWTSKDIPTIAKPFDFDELISKIIEITS